MSIAARRVAVIGSILPMLVACGEGPTTRDARNATQRTTNTPAQPQPPPLQSQPEEAPPRMDLAVTNIDVPSSVNRDQRFSTRVTVRNQSNTEARVASIDLRLSIVTPTHSLNLPAGSGVVREIGPHQQKTVAVPSNGPNVPGIGDLAATVRVLNAEDPNSGNDTRSTSLVIN
jgi:hypothetical protein